MSKTRLFGFLTACLLCAGCTRAPSVGIIGSFFPVWMVCLVAGAILTFASRFFLLRFHLESGVGPAAVFYPCLVTFFTCLLWLIFFH
jgi:hypothetical protein